MISSFIMAIDPLGIETESHFNESYTLQYPPTTLHSGVLRSKVATMIFATLPFFRILTGSKGSENRLNLLIFDLVAFLPSLFNIVGGYCI